MGRFWTMGCFVLLAAGLGAGLGGCTRNAPGMDTRPVEAVLIPARFERLTRLLQAARAAASAGNSPAVVALRESVSAEGMALLKARIPNDLRRQDVPRFLAARQGFGDALSQWVGAIERNDGAAVLQTFRQLDDATQGWIDAYLGRPTETAV